MPYTKPFSETVQERARRDPSFRKALLREAAECFLNGEPWVCMVILHDYVQSSIGIPGLADMTGRSPRSLTRLFSKAGAPQPHALLEVIQRLREHEDLRFAVTSLEGAEEPREDDDEEPDPEGAATPQPPAAAR